MTDLVPTDDPANGPPPTKYVGKRGAVIRPRLKTILDRMVWEGVTWMEAARDAHYHPANMRKALAQPHVMRYLREQRQVFRASASARNIHRAVEIRDQDENKTAAIQAIRYLDGVGDSEAQRDGARQVTPGVVVTVNVNRGPAEVDETLIEVNPAASQAADEQAKTGGYEP